MDIKESAVQSELMLSYGSVSVCVVNGLEVDFVTLSEGTPSYWQAVDDMLVRPLMGVDWLVDQATASRTSASMTMQMFSADRPRGMHR